MTQLIAPPEITIQTLPYGWKGKQRLAVTLMLATPIDHHQPYSTQDAWNGVMQVIPQAEIFDLGYPKPRGEVLVYGSYYAPEGFAISSDKVQLKVGKVSKELIVSGERLWRNILTPTPPEPFVKLPLTYEMGFGGPDDDRNPVGKGYPLASDSPMPQLEYPDQLLTKKRQMPQPAGLNATSVDWNPRKKLWGTYDAIWQERDAPFFARDLNPDFFMQAAADQWFEHSIPGATPIVLENMHPTSRKIEGYTPDYQFCFLAEMQGQLSLHQATADTLVLLPDINMQIVLARSELDIASLDGGEVSALMGAYRSANEPEKKLTHYASHLQLRRSEDITDDQLLDYSPLRPKSVVEPLTPLKLPEPGKPQIARPGPLTLSALAAAGGLAAKMAAAGKSKASTSDAGAPEGSTDTAASGASATANPPSVTEAQAEQVIETLKNQFAALGLTDQEITDLMQAPPEQVPEMINQILSKLFPDQPLPDPNNTESDPVINQQIDRAAQLTEDSSKAIPSSGDSSIDQEIAKMASTPGIQADFNTLSPLVEEKLDRINAELKALYDAYPGDKNELEQPSDVGTQAILKLLKGLPKQS